MDLLNYLQEEGSYQNLEDFQKEKIDEFKNKLLESRQEGISNLVLPAIELYKKGKELYKTFEEVSSNVEGKAGEVGEGLLSKVANVGENLLSKSGVGENLGKISDIMNISKTAPTVENDLSASIRGVGSRLSSKMMDRAFERDPELDIADANESANLIDRVGAFFRGGQNPVQNIGENLMSKVSQIGENVISKGSELAQTATNIGENVASKAAGLAETAGKVAETTADVAKAGEAASGLGELTGALSEALGPLAIAGMAGAGIYDLVESFKRTPTPQAYAAPALEVGV